MPKHWCRIEFVFGTDTPEVAARRMLLNIESLTFDAIVEVREETNTKLLGEFEYSQVLPFHHINHSMSY